MDYIVTWSLAALDDVDAIAEFIAQDSPAYATAVVDKVIDASRELRNSPKASRVVPELADPDIRERFVYSYRLIFRITDNTVLVVAVIHGKRLLEPLIDRINETQSGQV